MHTTLPALLLGLTACQLHPDATFMLVLDRQADGTYAASPQLVPELDDRERLSGLLGQGWRGGQLLMDGYRQGAPLHIDWTVQDDTAIPIDEDGLILWSFYHHLASARRDLMIREYETEALFPVDIAWNPVSVLDYSAAENAAYASSLQTFVLFPDLIAKDVPLAANAGVVRHELGHLWFHRITTGDMRAEPPWLGSGDAVKALNEGFADTVASQLLDDPRFIEASLDMPERDVSGDWTSDGLYPTGDESLLEPYDPYPLGTVFAALAWDVREATDPDTALFCAVSALESWSAENATQGQGWDQIDRYAVLLVQSAIFQGEAAGEAACASLRGRFPHVTPPERCE